MTNPLTDLVVDETKFDLDLLASMLRGQVNIMSGTGEVRLSAAALDLPKKYQVLVFLLGRKAAKVLGKAADEATSGREIASALGMEPNPVSGHLTFLKADGFVRLNDGKYSVPGYAVEKAKIVLEAQRKGKSK